MSIGFHKGTVGFEPWVELGAIRQVLGSPWRVSHQLFLNFFVKERNIGSQLWLNCDFLLIGTQNTFDAGS